MFSSKSFLSFSDPRDVNNITMLGISLGKGIDKSIANIKEQEHNRLVETSKREPKHKDKCDSDDDVESEIDSDLGLDHHAIQHLIGDIADDVFWMEGSPWSDFKPAPRKSKNQVQPKRIEVTRN
jgi:hypothetical protein